MTSYVALLYAVNVGGTAKLPMSDLKKICDDAGFSKVQTYIASGNVIFQSDKSESQVKAKLEKALHDYFGKPVAVAVRTAEEMGGILARNPFKDEAPNRTVALFLNDAPTKSASTEVSGQRAEMIELGKREIYVFYPEGIGESKLKIAAAKQSTARNMNTIAKLSQLLIEL